MNFGALAQLIQAILAGHASTGRTLLLDAVNIWATNVVIFALWFWTIDRRNPAAHGLLPEEKADFLSPNTKRRQVLQIRTVDTGFRGLSILGVYKCDGILARRHLPAHRQS